MSKQDLVILSVDLPSQKTGGTILNYEMVKLLSKHYNLHLFLLNTQEKGYKKKDIQETKKYTKYLKIIERKDKNTTGIKKQWLRILRLVSIKPRQKTLTDSKQSQKIITNYIKKNKIKKVFLTSMWASVLVDNFDELDAKLFALLVNVEHELFPTNGASLPKKIYYKWEGIRTKKYEKKVLQKISNLAALTKKDANKIKKFTNKNPQIIPPIMEPNPVKRKAKNNTLLLTTNQSFEPNRISNKWFFENVWKLVDKKVVLNITGLDYNQELEEIAKKYSNINYLGFVSLNQLNKLYEASEYVINPTITGSGFQIKTLDAISRGLPVISTKFSNHLGRFIQSSDNPKKLAKIINNPSKQKDKFNYQEFYQDNVDKLLDFLSQND